MQNQDMTMIKNDFTTLQLSYSLLQHTTTDQSHVLNKIESELNEQDDKIMELQSCLENFKESTTNDLEDLQLAVEDATDHPCGVIDDWTQVINFDMTDPTTTCPSNWMERTDILRTCGRLSADTSDTCFPETFSFSTGTAMTFSKVCGRVKAFTCGRPDGFQGFNSRGQTQISDAYVSGVILTTGSGFSEHLWTFVAGIAELQVRSAVTGALESDRPDQCPCDQSDPSSISVPDFVANQYFCEAAVNIAEGIMCLPDDPLWDGLNCNPESTCCDFNQPPYFVNDLGRTLTASSIDVRLCLTDTVDDILIEMIELYVAP